MFVHSKLQSSEHFDILLSIHALTLLTGLLRGWLTVKFIPCKHVVCHVAVLIRTGEWLSHVRLSQLCCVSLMQIPTFFAGIAVSLTSSAFWLGNFIIAQVTPILLASSLQTHGTFLLLVGVHVFAFLFVLLTLPETKVGTLS